MPYKNVKVTKKWTDHTGATDTAPVNSVKVDLLRDGVVIDTKDVKAQIMDLYVQQPGVVRYRNRS